MVVSFAAVDVVFEGTFCAVSVSAREPALLVADEAVPNIRT